MNLTEMKVAGNTLCNTAEKALGTDHPALRKTIEVARVCCAKIENYVRCQPPELLTAARHVEQLEETALSRGVAFTLSFLNGCIDLVSIAHEVLERRRKGHAYLCLQAAIPNVLAGTLWAYRAAATNFSAYITESEFSNLRRFVAAHNEKVRIP